jgi:hypothetical protein
MNHRQLEIPCIHASQIAGGFPHPCITDSWRIPVHMSNRQLEISGTHASQIAEVSCTNVSQIAGDFLYQSKIARDFLHLSQIAGVLSTILEKFPKSNTDLNICVFPTEPQLFNANHTQLL